MVGWKDEESPWRVPRVAGVGILAPGVVGTDTPSIAVDVACGTIVSVMMTESTSGN